MELYTLLTIETGILLSIAKCTSDICNTFLIGNAWEWVSVWTTSNQQISTEAKWRETQPRPTLDHYYCKQCLWCWTCHNVYFMQVNLIDDKAPCLRCGTRWIWWRHHPTLDRGTSWFWKRKIACELVKMDWEGKRDNEINGDSAEPLEGVEGEISKTSRVSMGKRNRS